MLKGKSGRLGLKIQPERTEGGRTYDPSNAVSYYVKKTHQHAPASRSAVGTGAASNNQTSITAKAPTSPVEELDDEIPF